MNIRFGLLRRVAFGLVCALTLSTAQASLPAKSQEQVWFDLPEVVTALDRDNQVSLQLMLRLSGPRAEKLARERLVKLRHALVLQLSDVRAKDFDAPALETLLEDFRLEANGVLGAKNAVRSVLVQKFVVQSK